MRTAWVVSIVLALLAGAAGTYYFTRVDVKVEAPPPAPAAAPARPMPDTFGKSNSIREVPFPEPARQPAPNR
jgi:hypothetical protein